MSAVFSQASAAYNWAPRAWAVLFVKLTIAGLIIGAMYYFGYLDLRHLETVSLTPRVLTTLGAGGVFILGALAVLAARLVLLARIQGVRLSWAQSLRITVLGNLVGALLPGVVAGDVVKLGFLCRLAPHRRAGASAAVLVDRLVGLYGLILLGAMAAASALAAGLAIRPTIIWLALAEFAIATLGAVGFLVFCLWVGGSGGYTARLLAAFQRLVAAVDAYRKAPVPLLLALLFSIASHALTVCTFICAACAIGDIVPLPFHFVLDPLAMLLNAVPISPGGLGLAEGAFAFLFSEAGSQDGGVIALTGRLLLYGVSVLVVLAPRLGTSEAAGNAAAAGEMGAS
jgi:uncharacterized protein (TIRG00374 family)